MRTLYTLGHSTRSMEDFLALLREYAIACLVDVRRFPGSRRHPHFAGGALAAALGAAGIEYAHEADLGGYRKSTGADSPNTAWRSASFRAYADYLDTDQFRSALQRLIGRVGKGAREAGARATAIMCAEAVPWRCHRQLISDALVARGLEVLHILEPGKSRAHELNAAARLLGDGRLVYPAPPPEQMGLFM